MILKTCPSDTQEKIKPNFLIVGAAKSGTTSLYYWLKQHPEVFLPDWKEPSYFVHDFGVSDWDQYLALFEPGRGKKAVGESSAAYLADPVSPEWIKKELGDVKIIISLRDPVGRIFSMYCYAVMYGYEWISTFEDVLMKEDSRLKSKMFRKLCPHYFWDYIYFGTGLYSEQIKRYLDTFSQVKISLLDDISNSPSKTYSEICEFIGIDNSFKPDFIPYNASSLPRFVKAQFILQQCLKPFRYRNDSISKNITGLLTSAKDFNIRLGSKSHMTPEMKEKLSEAYRKDILKVGVLINRDMSNWLCS
jgi:hypothetical protein